MTNFVPKYTQIGTLGDPQVKNKWSVAFTRLPAAITTFKSSDINLRAHSISLPTLSTDAITYKSRGISVHFAGDMKYSDSFEIELFEDDKTSAVLNFIDEWQQAIKNYTDQISYYKTEYTGTCLFYLLDYKNKPTKVFKMENAWLQDPDPVTDRGADAEQVMPKLKFKYDLFYDPTTRKGPSGLVYR